MLSAQMLHYWIVIYGLFQYTNNVHVRLMDSSIDMNALIYLVEYDFKLI